MNNKEIAEKLNNLKKAVNKTKVNETEFKDANLYTMNLGYMPKISSKEEGQKFIDSLIKKFPQATAIRTDPWNSDGGVGILWKGTKAALEPVHQNWYERSLSVLGKVFKNLGLYKLDAEDVMNSFKFTLSPAKAEKDEWEYDEYGGYKNTGLGPEKFSEDD